MNQVDSKNNPEWEPPKPDNRLIKLVAGILVVYFILLAIVMLKGN